MDAQTVVLVVTGLQKDESIFGVAVKDCRQLLKEVSGSTMSRGGGRVGPGGPWSPHQFFKKKTGVV